MKGFGEELWEGVGKDLGRGLFREWFGKGLGVGCREDLVKSLGICIHKQEQNLTNKQTTKKATSRTPHEKKGKLNTKHRHGKQNNTHKKTQAQRKIERKERKINCRQRSGLYPSITRHSAFTDTQKTSLRVETIADQRH